MKHKKRTNKRRTNKRRTNKKRTNKRRTNKRRYKYLGGNFNETQEQRLKNRLREIGFTDEHEINNIVVNTLGSSSQVFADPNSFEQLLFQISEINSPGQFRDWIQGWENIWDDEVQTDSENTPTN